MKEVFKTKRNPMREFAIVQREVLRYMTSTEFAIYVLLLSFQGNNEYCYPTVATLSDFSGLSERTVNRATSKLERDGWLIKQPIWNSSTRYYMYYYEGVSLVSKEGDTDVV